MKTSNTECIEPTVLVVGGINHDITAIVDRLPAKGETVVAHAARESTGGKACNQAVAASLWGASTVLIARVGDDSFGNSAIQVLENVGVNTAFLHRDPAGTGLGLVFMDATGAYLTSVVPRANAYLGAADIRLPERLWKDVAIVVLQLETPIETSILVAKEARKRNRPVVLNASPASAQLLAPLRDFVTILVVNEHEAAILAGMPVHTMTDAERASGKLASDKTSVVITLGSLGALAREADGTVHIFVPASVEAVDTLGAGDQFLGVLAAEIAFGRPLADALQSAGQAATISVTKPGVHASFVRREKRRQCMQSSAPPSGTSTD